MFATFSEPVQVLLFRLTGINGLPLMMGLIFYLQQKYMTPPATGTQTPEQEQMQKIMRWMLVITFPLFLYGAPSGLTLYIVTSSTIGILESRWIRKKVDTMDLDSDPPPKPPTTRRWKRWRFWRPKSGVFPCHVAHERRRDTRKKQDGRETRVPPPLIVDLDSTILAVATPSGQSARGMIRIAGPHALAAGQPHS